MGNGIRFGKKSSNKCGDSKMKIIDEDVYKAEKGSTTNIALSKKYFAEKIASRQALFDSIDFESFVPIFEIIRDILLYDNNINTRKDL